MASATVPPDKTIFDLDVDAVKKVTELNLFGTILAHTPIGRFLEPDELVGTLHYLASDASKAVTGTVSVIDGGFDAFSI